MNRRLELIDALLTLSKQVEKVARLLTQDTIGELYGDTLVPSIVDTSKKIPLDEFASWPEAAITNHRETTKSNARHLIEMVGPIDRLNVLEMHKGPTLPLSTFTAILTKNTDLIIDDPQEQIHEAKIVSIKDIRHKKYDLGIICESLEFWSNPADCLTTVREHCKRIFIRMRPWSSRDGGFQSHFFNRAYAHLATELDTSVLYKVVRPLATYETLFQKNGLTVESRQIYTQPVDFITDDILDVMIARTWGTLPREEARRIMGTSAIEYVLTT